MSADAQETSLAYRNGDGEWTWTDASTFDATFSAKAGAATETVEGIFNLTYRDVEEETGVGFDDPELGETRRATMHAVLSYLAEVLDVPGTADLVILPSQTDGSGALAAAGPFLVPVSGFQGGLVYEHLLTGVDPVRSAADGTVSVDFGFRWNSELDAPEDDEQDLYTTLLHEVTHALGLLSAVASDGRSAVFNSGERGLFSIFDSFLLRRSTGLPLFLEGGEFNAIAEDLASGDLVFTGERARAALGRDPRVFAPSPFREGSSIGHWSTANGFDSVMLPALAPGVVRREYREWELQALADLGYDLAADAPSVDPPEPTTFDPRPREPATGMDGGVDDFPTPDEEVPAGGVAAAARGSGCAVRAGAPSSVAWALVALGLWASRRRRLH